MENENMNYVGKVMKPEFEVVEMVADKSGIGVGTVLLIGGGLTLATVAAVKLGKKVWKKYKSKKELRLVDENDNVEPTEEDIMAVTKK